MLLFDIVQDVIVANHKIKNKIINFLFICASMRRKNVYSVNKNHYSSIQLRFQLSISTEEAFRKEVFLHCIPRFGKSSFLHFFIKRGYYQANEKWPHLTARTGIAFTT